MADRLPAGLRGATDLVVVDVFAGATIPAPVTTVEFYRLAARLLNAFRSWRMMEVGRRARAESALRRVAAQASLSANVKDIAERCLA